MILKFSLDVDLNIETMEECKFETETTVEEMQPKEKREVPKVYTAFGRTFPTPQGAIFTSNNEELVKDLRICSVEGASCIYVQEKDFPLEAVRDFWLYFRSSFQVVKKYGKPPTAIDTLGQWEMYHTYTVFEPFFLEFIEVDEKTNPKSSLFLKMISHDGSQFIISRLKPDGQKKYDAKFLVYNFPGTENIKEMPCERFRDMLEEKTGKTLEELTLNGKVITTLIMTGCEVVQ